MASHNQVLDLINALVYAITNRHPVTLRYTKPGGATGYRLGYPYVLHSMRRASDDEELLYLEFYQVDGDTVNGDLPGLRKLLVEHVELTEVHSEHLFMPPTLNQSKYGICLAIAE